ncbi:MAG: MBL fold metallo-hydrolase [Draconibacterium sp.]|nr:MBL fold metallo-hydrolase [Draconibacterium sp.]
MKKIFAVLFCVFATYGLIANDLEKDNFKTSEGDLAITFVGHGTLMMEFQGKIIHVDPYSRLTDYSKLPKADLILITHHHGDHLDVKAIDQIKKDNTSVVLTKICSEKYTGTTVLGNGENTTFQGIKIEAVPAYNIQHKRGDGSPFHPKGDGNGYILNFGDKKVYVAGDTENIPEMKNLGNIDIAFLPMNLPYTMTPKMVADAAKTFKPKVLYPYHFGQTNTKELVDLLKNETDIEVRIRKF